MNGRCRSLFSACTAALLLGLLASCQSVPTRLYRLDEVAPVAATTAYAGPALRVDAVHIPPTLDRLEIVSSVAHGELKVSDLDHWSAPLGELVKQALSSDLMARLAPGRLIFPHMKKPPGALGIAVDILDFKQDRDGYHLAAGWIIAGQGTNAPERRGVVALTAPGGAAAGTAAGTVRALSALVAQLADGIAAELPTIARTQRADEPVRQRLVGTWRLVAIDYQGPDGRTIDPFYQAGSSGTLTYDLSGWMSVQIAAPDRRAWNVPAVRVPPGSAKDSRRKADAFDGYYAYYGTWDYDAGASLVTHHVEASMIPSERGMDYAQAVSFEGERLVFTVRTGNLGSVTVRKKIWERLVAKN